MTIWFIYPCGGSYINRGLSIEAYPDMTRAIYPPGGLGDSVRRPRQRVATSCGVYDPWGG